MYCFNVGLLICDYLKFWWWTWGLELLESVWVVMVELSFGVRKWNSFFHIILWNFEEIELCLNKIIGVYVELTVKEGFGGLEVEEGREEGKKIWIFGFIPKIGHYFNFWEV